MKDVQTAETVDAGTNAAAADQRAARAVLLETRHKRAPAGLAPRLVHTPDGFDLRCALARPESGARGTVTILTDDNERIEADAGKLQIIPSERKQKK